MTASGTPRRFAGCRISDAIGAKRTCRERRERVDRTKVTPTAWTGRALQAESTLALLYPALAWSRSLLALMDIRARPISFSDRPSKASRVTRSRDATARPVHLLKSNSQTSAGNPFRLRNRGGFIYILWSWYVRNAR
jgi:hypothetical protein